MRLTGQQKEKLREGILGAYPNQDELRVLLSEKMDLKWSAIARGEDYTSKIAYLVEQLEADGKVIVIPALPLEPVAPALQIILPPINCSAVTEKEVVCAEPLLIN